MYIRSTCANGSTVETPMMHSSGCILIRGQSIIAVFAKPPVECRFISNVQRIVLEWRIYLDNPYWRLHPAELWCLVISRPIPPATAWWNSYSRSMHNY
ncbi:hypothetical protein RSAG8_04611, partial [Rhizoctonia solani AG-8 WAC10335]